MSKDIINSLIIGNKKTKIYHKTNCYHVKKEMNSSNMVELDSNFKDSKGNNYRPCGHCKPYSKWFDARVEMANQDTLDLYNKGNTILKANRREPLADLALLEDVL